MPSPFHADKSIAAATALPAGGLTLLFDPNGIAYEINSLQVATDTAMRIGIVCADIDGQRVRVAWLAANGGFSPSGLKYAGSPGTKLYVLMGAQGNVEVQVDGCLLDGS